jgi:NAD(P)-dependent dehydrogenase (short-subunit alcohol dehydrogenase family)
MATAQRKLIVLTGATRGLGRAMAERFAAAGHTVAGCGTSAAMIEELNARFGGPHRFARVDVSVDREVREWADRVLSELGAPDLLINNAAVINRNSPLWEVSDEDFSRVVNVNITGTANIIRHFVPVMLERRSGVIVNFSSGWGRSTSAEVAPYCASKWAIEGLTQALAQELPRGMAAVALNPGVIDTEMLRSCFGSASANYPGPEEWSRAAVPFLLQLGPADNGEPLTVPL